MAGIYNAASNYICTTKTIPRKSVKDLFLPDGKGTYIINGLISEQQQPDPEGSSYLIPLFQRKYCWSENHLITLIEDAIKQANPNVVDTTFSNAHSLGRITVANKENNLVIDGQQRLTTLSICLAAIRDFMVKNEVEFNNETISKIQNCLFHEHSNTAFTDYQFGEGISFPTAKLIPTYYDRLSFSKCIYPLVLNKSHHANYEHTNQKEKASIFTDTDCIAVNYRKAFVCLESIGMQNQILAKFGESVTEDQMQNALYRKQIVAKIGKILFESFLYGFSFLKFDVEQDDHQTIYERLAFKAKMFSFMHQSREGENMIEDDLIRNLVLSYFQTEEKRIELFMNFWKVIEKKWENRFEAMMDAVESYYKQNENKLKMGFQEPIFNVPYDIRQLENKENQIQLPEKTIEEDEFELPVIADSTNENETDTKNKRIHFNTETELNEIRRRKKEKSQRRQQQKQQQQQQTFQGGSMHLMFESYFPCYIRIRKFIERVLEINGIDAKKDFKTKIDKIEVIVEKQIRLFYELGD